MKIRSFFDLKRIEIVLLLLCLSATGDAAEKGFTQLFDGETLNGWHLENGAEFIVRDGVIEHQGGLGWLRSEKQYADFNLRLEFRFLEPKQDGGVFLRTGISGDRWPDPRYEVQIENTERMAKIFRAEYDLNIELAQKALKPTGEWNEYEIRLIGSNIEVFLNGELVTRSDRMNNLKRGYIGLQGENGAHEYRNIRIKDLSDPVPSIQFVEGSPIPGENDRIGWSADGNKNDEDDWGATALALAIFAKQGWQDKLVHIDYNNWLAGNTPYKSAEETISVQEGLKKFHFTRTRAYDNQTDLEAAIDSAVAEINKSTANNRFWYVQAGPFEVAYRALLKADPEKRQYCILVSHAPINERPNKWPDQHGKEDCIALGASYFFTTPQGKLKFGGPQLTDWGVADWMKNSPSPEYRWVYSRMRKTAEHKEGMLDASDGGMAFVLATGDTDGNFNPKLRDFLGTDWDSSAN